MTLLIDSTYRYSLGTKYASGARSAGRHTEALVRHVVTVCCTAVSAHTAVRHHLSVFCVLHAIRLFGVFFVFDGFPPA